MTGREVTTLINASCLPVAEIAARLCVPVITLEAWMLAGIPETYDGMFQSAINWIEFQVLRPTDAQLAETHRKVDEVLAGTGF
jgi:hypothetical protein